MKLLELSTPKKSEQLSQIVESFFGKKLNVTALTVEQATSMLTKTQNLIKEVTNSTKFHSSEKNPAYLQALIIEQSLQAYLNEYGADQKNPYPEPIDTKQLTQGVQKTAAAFGAKPAALIKGLTASSQGQPMGSQEKAALGQLSGSIGKALADPNKAQKLKQLVMNDKRSVMESEVTTAQVVLAAQDMVDRIQKMYEEVAEMQYKDLPSLATSMKEELGINATQTYFDTQLQTLSTLVGALNQAKQSMDVAMSSITGQEMIDPVDFKTADDTADDTAALASPEIDEPSLPPADNLPTDEDEPELVKNFGRDKR